MALAKAYRPGDFDEIAGAGNKMVVKAVKAILTRKKEEIPHTWLFIGFHGCGKTTMGRLVAAALGCKGLDYKEVDSADARGIDAIREIRRSVSYPPMESDCRIWLLDECHKITKDGKDDLLKVTEEPPDHVYFILCTTDPQELSTILRSRCVTFEMQPLSEEEMAEFLREIVSAERKRVPLDVLKQIATDSMGSCRDALQVLEKVIDLPKEDMLAVAATTAARNNAVIELYRALIKGEKWGKLGPILSGLEKENLEQVRQGMLTYCSNVLMKDDNPRAFLILDSFEKPFFNNGKAGLVLACYKALNG
jgi:DNA polymerase III gamma/tau subunit